VPGLHYVVFVRSPHAHARIQSIDATAARRRPGVRLVLTGEDIRAKSVPLPIS
jgi:carbon-monoxide dehydrogenase large subunit